MKHLHAPISLLATGDIILGDNAEACFVGVDAMLADADVVMGHLEVPYSDRAPEFADLSRKLINLTPLASRFDMLSMAANHIYDAKEIGIIDTLTWLNEHALPVAGVGLNIDEARKPAIIEINGIKIGMLSYNCTGPKMTSATRRKPGCAYVNIISRYDLGNIANPGGNPETVRTWPETASFEQMKTDIRSLRSRCDVLCVYLHKGLVHKPVKLAEYEQIVSHGAIDAGADIIFSSHAHILHGIEVYQGKTIYHGLNNFIAWVPSLRPDFKANKGVSNDLFNPEEWAQKRIEMFGFTPDPDYPTYPFHPEAIYTIMAKCIINDGHIVETRFIPMIVNQEGLPIVVSRQNGGETVMAYMQKITQKAGLNAEFSWDGDEVVIQGTDGMI